MRTADGKFAPYILQCAWHRPPGWKTKGCPVHYFPSSTLNKAYCSIQHRHAAESQRKRDRRLQDGFELPWLNEPGDRLRRKKKEKTPIVGATKYPDEMVNRGQGALRTMNEPQVERCPNCGAITYGECRPCQANW